MHACTKVEWSAGFLISGAVNFSCRKSSKKWLHHRRIMVAGNDTPPPLAADICPKGTHIYAGIPTTTRLGLGREELTSVDYVLKRNDPLQRH